jgi:hypothetical protein
MAIRIPIISDFQGDGIKQAKIAFGNFKTAVAEAEGGIGKFKAGSKVALDAVAANAGLFAITGGIAFGKFAASGITAFTDLALQAGKFADATGLELTKASGYIEAAGDIGVPIDAVEGAIGRLNKTIGADPDKVRNLGVDLVYLRDGSLDVNKTFLNTIDRIKGIKDPAERARTAAQLLGKGWQSMAELIMGGSEKLNASLKSVSEQKLISPEELQMAKDYRAAMDNLGDSVDDVKLKTGEKLVKPATWFAQAAELVLDLDTKFNNLFKREDPLGFIEPKINAFRQNIRDARDDNDNFKESIKQARVDAIMPFKDKIVEATTALIDADTAWKNLTGRLQVEVALDTAKTKLDNLKTAAVKAFSSGSQQDVADYRQKLLDVTTSIADLATGMDNASSHQVKILVDKGDLEGAVALIAQIKAFQKTYANVSDPYAAVAGANKITLPPGFDLSGFKGFKASGGPVVGGSSYIVGERGPELFTPGTSGNITPNRATGGNTITVNVNGGDPNSIVRALQQYVRQSGPVPVNTRAM